MMERVLPMKKARILVGLRLLHLKEVGSTNTIALNCPELLNQKGLVILADKQTKGRGRMERSWYSGGKRHLFCSIIFHPVPTISRTSTVTILSGLAVYRVLRRYGVRDLSIKWPNDILIRGKKVCGILVETRGISKLEPIVIGIGINIEGDELQFPVHIRPRITTLQKEGVRDLDPVGILNKILDELDKILLRFSKKDSRRFFTEWEEASSSIGKKIIFYQDNVEKRGRILGLGQDGELMVETFQGNVIPVISGEVVFY